MTSSNLLSPPSWREKYRVRISLIAGFIFVWRAQPRILLFLVLGIVLSFIGILLRQWAAGCVKKMDELAREGPYAIVRHPLYSGSFLIALGLVLSATSFSKLYLDRSILFWSFLWILFDSIYISKVNREEEELKSKFSQSYDEYSKSVPRFIPKTFNLFLFNFNSFQLKLWVKNREYQALAGYVGICFILIYRYLHR